jgi:hypothetical protein
MPLDLMEPHVGKSKLARVAKNNLSAVFYICGHLRVQMYRAVLAGLNETHRARAVILNGPLPPLPSIGKCGDWFGNLPGFGRKSRPCMPIIEFAARPADDNVVPI